MNPNKSGSELRCAGRVSSSCSTSGTRRVNLATNPVISHDIYTTNEMDIGRIFRCLVDLFIAHSDHSDCDHVLLSEHCYTSESVSRFRPRCDR
jgi:hypothetical protein